MKTPGYITTDQPPTAAEYIALRCKVGWDNVELNTAQSSLNSSLFNTTVSIAPEASFTVTGFAALLHTA